MPASVGWDDDSEVRAWPGRPALDGDRNADCCVVGLGASGLAALADLRRRGISAIGIDAGRVAGAAAGRNGGFLLAGPAEPLHNAIKAWGVDAAVQCYRATLAELDATVAELGPDIVRRTGSLRVALPDPLCPAATRVSRRPAGRSGAKPGADELEDCAAQRDAMRAHGFAVEDYSGDVGNGLYFPADAAMHPARRALARARELDGTPLFEHTPALRIEPRRVTTPHGVITCGTVLVAVDGRLAALFPRLPVRTARLQMLATAPVASRLPCPVYARWGYDYAQQDASGRLFVGGGRDLFAADEWTQAADPTPPVQRYLDGLAARFAGGPVTVTHRWAASVGFTRDARPVCAEVDVGVVAVGGYSGTGNLVGPVAARAGVALLVDGLAPPSWLTSKIAE